MHIESHILRKIPKRHLISWCGNFVERHSFYTRKLGEILVFYARIEIVWNQLKCHVLHLNVYTNQLSKVVNLIRKVFTTENWINYTNHVNKEGEKFCVMDYMFDNEIEPFIIHLPENDNAYDSCDEM